MTRIEELVRHFRRQRGWTRRLVAAIPEDRFDWAPASETFSCGDLVRHLMQAEIFWRKLLIKGTVEERFDPFGIEGEAVDRLRAFRGVNLESSRRDSWGTSPAECLAGWQTIESETVEAFAALPEAALDAIIEHPLLDIREPLSTLFVMMFEHEAHHRGQLSAYLKMMGVEQPPGTYGLRSDQAPSAAPKSPEDEAGQEVPKSGPGV